jgi:hypothetical protein
MLKKGPRHLVWSMLCWHCQATKRCKLESARRKEPHSCPPSILRALERSSNAIDEPQDWLRKNWLSVQDWGVRSISDLERGVNHKPYKNTLDRLIQALQRAKGGQTLPRSFGWYGAGARLPKSPSVPLQEPSPLLQQERMEAEPECAEPPGL